MEIIIGRDMLNTNFPTGIVPILFSAAGADPRSLIVLIPPQRRLGIRTSIHIFFHSFSLGTMIYDSMNVGMIQ